MIFVIDSPASINVNVPGTAVTSTIKFTTAASPARMCPYCFCKFAAPSYAEYRSSFNPPATSANASVCGVNSASVARSVSTAFVTDNFAGSYRITN